MDNTAQPQQPQPNDYTLMEQQLYIYAQEVRHLYENERKEREALAEEKLMLENRLRELSALNNLFQQHLEHRMVLDDALEQTMDTLRQIVQEELPEPMRHKLMDLLRDIRRARALTGKIASP